MHKKKFIWSHCETCGKGQTYTAYTVHKRFSACECGSYVFKRTARNERMISNPEIESINYLESYALAWGA